MYASLDLSFSLTGPTPFGVGQDNISFFKVMILET